MNRKTAGVVLVVAFSLLSVVQAQEKNEGQLTFKSKTELVVVPVLVRDKNGAPIKDLKQEDFTLLENGTERKIAFFEDVQTNTERMKLPEAEPGSYTNVIQGQNGSKRVTILVLDVLNTPIMDQNYARQQLLKYLSESLDATEPTAFFILNRDGLRLITDFTNDPKVLIAAINKMKERQEKLVEDAAATQRDIDTLERMAANQPELAGIIRNMQAMTQDYTSNVQRASIVTTLQAMQQLALYSKGIPGRKALVWATGGFPFQLAKTGDFPFEMTDKVDATNRGARDSYADVAPLYISTWNALTDANVAIYAVDVRGLMPTASMRVDQVGSVGSKAIRAQQNSSVDWDQLQSHDTLRAFSDATGGKAFLNNNDLTKGFREAAKDSEDYYLVSYYLDREAKPGWHKLSVRVKREGMHVRARTGFYVAKPGEEKQIAELDTYTALRSPINYTEIPLVFRWSDQAAGKEKGRRKVQYEVDLPANAVIIDDTDKNRMVVQFLALVRDKEGKEVGHPESRKLDMFLTPESLSQVRENGITYRNVIELPPGDYNVRFVIRDVMSGRMGSVSAPIVVEKL